MAELLKNSYNHHSIEKLASRIKIFYNQFDDKKFVKSIFDKSWDQLNLKARMQKIAKNLGQFLPTDYKKALVVIDQVLINYSQEFNAFVLMCFPCFVEIYGQDENNLDLSITALEKYTSHGSAEFAIRPFIANYQKQMIKQMNLWTESDNEHVRRLASEGCRPQLPWGKVLHSFKKDPTPILGILEKLKTDSSLYVRKSVANNLNDIAKTHPQLVIKIVKKWYGKNKHTDWIVKHGCRTLLKNGNKELLNIFGFTNDDCIDINDFKLNADTFSIGDNMTVSFNILSKKTANIRLEYAIDYVKANGKRNRKIFQISKILLKENQQKSYVKKHSLANKTTRKHYAGIHSINLIVNGIAKTNLDFEIK